MQFPIKTPLSVRKVALGLTVLEMLIVIAALAVIVLISVPGSGMLLAKYQLESATKGIHEGLELARTEAQLRNSKVVMCPSSNGHVCRRDGNWNMGWLVYTDGNDDGVVEDIELIRSFEAPSNAIHIIATGAVQSRAAFTLTGLVPDNGAKAGQFKICLEDSDKPPKLLNILEEGWLQEMPARDQNCSSG